MDQGKHSEDTFLSMQKLHMRIIEYTWTVWQHLVMPGLLVSVSHAYFPANTCRQTNHDTPKSLSGELHTFSPFAPFKPIFSW